MNEKKRTGTLPEPGPSHRRVIAWTVCGAVGLFFAAAVGQSTLVLGGLLIAGLVAGLAWNLRLVHRLRDRAMEIEALAAEGVGDGQDRADRRATTEALRRERDRAQQYLDIAGVILLALDAKGRITLLNREGHRILGYEEGQLVGRDWFDVCLPRERQTAVRAAFARLMSGNVELDSYNENEVLNRWGRERVVAWRNAILRDESGRIVGTLSSGEDITDRERAKQELLAAKRAAEAASAGKTEFLASMSHEIRTPMTAILGFADLLLESLDRGEDLDAAETIRRNGNHLLSVINGILDLSKIEAGKLEIQRVACSPCPIVADVASLMRIRAEARGLTLSVHFDGAIPATIVTDPTRLRQILLNLVGNAIKCTERGGVEIRARLADHPGPSPKLLLEVTDTGIGIAPAKIDSLFEPFAQGETAAGCHDGGTGLGLTISKRLAEMLGGGISVRSAPGKGSTFRVTIDTGPLEGVPIMDPPTGNLLTCVRTNPAASLPDVQLGCRILLVEDSPDNRRLLSRILGKAGAQVTLASDGKAALDRLRTAALPNPRAEDLLSKTERRPKVPFDLVLMDMQMPVMDGYEATRQFRRAGYAGPILALTAHAMNRDIQRCLEAGCDAHMAKPIDRKTLLETIACHLERPGKSGDAVRGEPVADATRLPAANPDSHRTQVKRNGTTGTKSNRSERD